MRATREEQRIEALRRMEELHLDKLFRTAFLEGTLAVSEKFEGTLNNGILIYEIPKCVLNEIRTVEKDFGIVAYAVIRSRTEFGEIFDLLYIGREKEDWEWDNQLMEDHVVMSYCINTTISMFSELGTIGIANIEGGLYRIY